MSTKIITVKLHTLALPLNELLKVIYYTTGRRYALQLPGVGLGSLAEWRERVLSELKESMHFEAGRLFEDEDAFLDAPFSRRTHKVKRMRDDALVMLRHFREHGISLTICGPKADDDLKVLWKMSPALAAYAEGRTAQPHNPASKQINRLYL